MTYTCACYPHPDATLEEAQENKYRLVFEKLRLKPGDRLLDVGCGWGGMVRYAARHGVKAIGVTLSKEQAAWAQKAIADQGLTELAEVRHGDYRDVRETNFDAVSSIGLTEHIGVQNYPSYFRFLKSKMRTGALLLNHCVTRPDNKLGHGGRFHRPLRLPRRRADRLGPDHHRGAGRRPGSGARREPAAPLRDDAARLVRQSRRALGRGGRRGRISPRRCGASTWPARDWASKRISFSCTRFWRSNWTSVAVTAGCRCGRGGHRKLCYVIRFPPRTAIFLGSSAIGLLVAAWLVPGVSLSPLGFIAAVVIFTVAQAILSPFFLKMASRYASAFLGGIGLVSTLVALILASLLSNGLSIRGIGSWVAATVVVWLVTALATLVLPVLVLRQKKNQ